MANYIETRITHEKVTEGGQVKKATDRFIVDALTFTEAEARIIKERTPYISGEFEVSAVIKTRYAEVFRNGDGKWYVATLAFMAVDERSGCEKRTNHRYLVEAVDFVNAYENLLDAMKGTMADFEIVSIAESPIIEVYAQQQ